MICKLYIYICESIWYVKPRGPNCSKMSVGLVGSTEGYFYFNWKMIDRHGRCSFKVNVH